MTDTLAPAPVATDEVERPAAEAQTPEDESDEAAEEGAETSAARSAARTTRNIVTFKPENEPYEAGKCTVLVTLTIRPDDGHSDGRLVLIGAATHDEEPFLTVARLNKLALPGEIVTAIEQCELSLPARGKVRAEKDAKAKAEEEARKARQARKTVKGKTVGAANAAPAAPLKPAPAPSTDAALAQVAQQSLF
jgi:hypothetical protein